MILKRTQPFVLITKNRKEVRVYQFRTKAKLDNAVENLVVGYGEEGKKDPIVYYGM